MDQLNQMSTFISAENFKRLHPANMFMLGLKDYSVIDYFLSCTNSEISDILKEENHFFEQIKTGAVLFDRPLEYKRITNMIKLCKTNLEFLRDNVTKEEMKVKRYNRMNALGRAFDVIQEQLETFNNL